MTTEPLTLRDRFARMPTLYLSQWVAASQHAGSDHGPVFEIAAAELAGRESDPAAATAQRMTLAQLLREAA
jgi:hypothetical protein